MVFYSSTNLFSYVLISRWRQRVYQIVSKFLSFYTALLLRDDDVPGDVLKLLGEGGLKIMMKLINTIYETGEWPKDFTEVTMNDLENKPQATKCSDHRTISLIAHTAKIVARILKGLKVKLRMYSEKISLDLEEEKEIRMQMGC